MRIFISQPMIGKTTEEILKERREIIDWCKNKFSKPKQCGDIKFIGSFIPSSSYKKRSVWMLELIIADIAIFVKGWENEKECMIEYEICSNCGIITYEL